MSVSGAGKRSKRAGRGLGGGEKQRKKWQLCVGNRVQKEFLQAITLREGELVQLDPHLSAVEDADDRTGRRDGRRSRG